MISKKVPVKKGMALWKILLKKKSYILLYKLQIKKELQANSSFSNNYFLKFGNIFPILAQSYYSWLCFLD